jgi:hypothetical protein
MDPHPTPHDPYRQTVPALAPEPEVVPYEIPPSESTGDSELGEQVTVKWEPGERLTVKWAPATQAHDRAVGRRQSQQWEAVRALSRLWACPYTPGSVGEAMMEYTRNLGWDRMGAIYDAVHPLPWSILQPLAAMPAWAIWPGGVSTPLTDDPSESEHRIRQLPEDLDRWRPTTDHAARRASLTGRR